VYGHLQECWKFYIHVLVVRRISNSVTSWSWFLLENVTRLELVKKLPTFYGAQWFITAFRRTHHLSQSWAHRTYGMWINCNILCQKFTNVARRMVTLTNVIAMKYTFVCFHVHKRLLLPYAWECSYKSHLRNGVNLLFIIFNTTTGTFRIKNITLREFHCYSSVTSVILHLQLLVCKRISNCCQDNHIIYYAFQSCRGCRLNRLPEVKKFIFEDVPLLYP
jgi:hypothetical protein